MLLESQIAAKILLGLLSMCPLLSIILFLIGIKRWKSNRTESKKLFMYSAVALIVGWIGFMTLLKF